MPKSRKRTSEQDRRHNPLTLDGMFDHIVEHPFATQVPPILYHYTSWSGAEGILKSQKFWATAHNCTNDEAELQSADTTIMEVAREVRRKFLGSAATVLETFMDNYHASRLSNLTTIYLACFSAARDDQGQWRKYSDEGRGVCLGLRMLAEPPPKNPHGTGGIIKVDYSEQSWRAAVKDSFEQICRLLGRADNSTRTHGLGLSALYRIAAFMSIAAKQEQWANEQEYRHVTLPRPNVSVPIGTRLSGERTIRYLPVTMRDEGKPIALAEIIIGPIQNLGEARERVNHLLTAIGYSGTEYPTIAESRQPRTTAVPM